MADDKTVRMVTDLDRKAVKGNLAAHIEKTVQNALLWLADKPQHQRITIDLELVELNLKNLK